MSPFRPLAGRLARAGLIVHCACTSLFAAPPGEVALVDWCAGSTRCLFWAPQAGATSYLVYRGEGTSLGGLADSSGESCRSGEYAAPTTDDFLRSAPPPGGLYWYLVTARNADGEGSAGSGAAGPRQLDAPDLCRGDIVFRDRFEAPGGSPWPSPWAVSGGVDLADVSAGSGRCRPAVSFYSLGRLHVPMAESDVEATFTLQFEELQRQGVGFYVRQNGGYLQQTAPHGQGYAVFVEGFRGQGIGLWRELDGIEESLAIRFDPMLGLLDGVRYRVRFRVTQAGPGSTLLQARIWPEGGPEPQAWDVEITDSTPQLQGVAGGIAADSWNTITPNTPGSPPVLHTLIDDVEIVRL